MNNILAPALAGALSIACSSLPAASDNTDAVSSKPSTQVVLASEVTWEHLNPARGDKSPKAGTLWGDRKGSGPTGFLLKPADGFQSPPHIHNVSYRGVVISGLIHNDDPEAGSMWMPAGSFWTQPKGEVHITAAKGGNTLAYIEIEQGPYLILPTEEAFDSGERPVNVDETNIVWLDASNLTWLDQPGMPASDDGPKAAFLWGTPQEGDKLSGTLVKLPAGFTGKLRSRGASLRAVVVQGRLQHRVPGKPEIRTLEPGGFFGSQGASVHRLSSDAEGESIIYLRSEGGFDLVR